MIVFAEAGSGKTREMEFQARRLVAGGKSAFFIPIEVLTGQDVRDYLSMEPGEAERLDGWLAEDGRPGWFFLDAVDELKLSSGKLDTALGKVARALGTALNRAHVILSCRPTDWRPVHDLQTFEKRLPVAEAVIEPPLSGDDEFLAGFREQRTSKSTKDEEPTTPRQRLVVLLPLGEKQIRHFAASEGVTNIDLFMQEIRRHEAWSFARRPLDLRRLIDGWKTNHRLGTLLEQHQLDVEHALQDDPERPDKDILAPSDAVEGAERLALALLMSRNRTVKVPEQSTATSHEVNSLDARLILADWTEAKVQALLRRSIFDPATYGRVRFHHRSVQEYLAARRLNALRKKGMPWRSLKALLFAERYGDPVVIPSTRPIAAWLALWDDDVLRMTLSREPEVLVLYGDPESLPLAAKAKLLAAYVEAYGDGDWRGLDMPITEIRRFACAELAPDIRRCWDESHSNEEIREFLLKVIWQGEINACVDIAIAAAMDTGRSDYARTLAVRAIGVLNPPGELRRIADDVMRNPDRWSAKLHFGIVYNLFPAALSVDELVTLLQRVPEPASSTSGFSWALYNLVDDIDPRSAVATELGNALASLIWENRSAECAWHHMASDFDHLSAVLARLIENQIAAGITPDPDMTRAAVMATRFHERRTLGREEVKAILNAYATNPVVRQMTFEIEYDVMTQIAKGGDARDRLFQIYHHGLLNGIAASDWPWMMEGLKASEHNPGLNAAYFAALVDLWFTRGKQASDLAALKEAAGTNSSFLSQIAEMAKPPAPNLLLEKHELERKQRQAEHDAQVLANEKAWLEWKAKLEADVEAAFADDRRIDTLCALMNWLDYRAESFDGGSGSNWREVRRVLGDDVGGRFEAGLVAYWRGQTPPLASFTKGADSNRRTRGMTMALTGLIIEAVTVPNWTASLSNEHARLAAGWGTLDFNHFPKWFHDLAAAHGDIVRTVLIGELELEFQSTFAQPQARVLSALEYGSDVERALVVDYLKTKINSWPKQPADEPDAYCMNLDRTFAILAKSGALDDAVARTCAERFQEAPTTEIGRVWLQGLFASDLGKGAESLSIALDRLSAAERMAWGIRWMAALFGDRDYHHVPILVDGDATLLVRLTKLAYQCVRREDDVVHDTVYTPDTRDNAESARNRLLSALIGKPGGDAHAALVALAKEPLFQHMTDRMRLMARERAASDSERRALTEAEIRVWEERWETVPRNRDELFQVMMDRLDDIDHDLRHHDFTERPILLPIEEESAMQLVLTKKMQDAARGCYRVSREEEVADKKETDIRLSATGFDGRAVIEIKIGDRCSLNGLEATITEQLVGKYMRHNSCTAGCLLITYGGRKGFHDPQGGGSLTFAEVINRLNAYAAKVEQDERGRIRLGVVGLDLTNPLAA